MPPKVLLLIMAIERVPATALTRKRSVTLAGGLIAEVEELAGPRGFSAATAEALTHWVARTRLRRAIEAYEAEAGEITQAGMDAAVAESGGL